MKAMKMQFSFQFILQEMSGTKRQRNNIPIKTKKWHYPMKINLDKSSKIILKECMGLKRNESCLIVTDSKLKKIGEALFRESLRLAKKSKLVFTNIPKS